jgi:TatD DNase family protein
MSKKHKPKQWPEMEEKLPSGVVDTHSHIDMIKDFVETISATEVSKGREPVPERSIKRILQDCSDAGVVTLINSACELPDIEKISEFLTTCEGNDTTVYGAVAIHPNEAALHSGIQDTAPDGLPIEFQDWHKTSLNDAIATVYETAKADPRIVLIGETGMDQFRTSELGIKAQETSFREHIKIAEELGLAVQIHDRNTHQEILQVLKDVKPTIPVIFHSFSGDKDFAEELVNRGYYLSFSGTATFKSNTTVQEAAISIPVSQLLVETDCPFLTPEPYRGHPNAPFVMTHTVRFLAQLLNIDLLNFCNITRENTNRALNV